MLRGVKITSGKEHKQHAGHGHLGQARVSQALLNDPLGRISTHAFTQLVSGVVDAVGNDGLGFQNPANFTRAFRGWTGKTPSEYRRLRVRG